MFYKVTSRRLTSTRMLAFQISTTKSLLTDSDLFASFIPGAQIRVKRQGVIDTRRFEAYVRRTRIAGTYTDHPEWVAARRAFPELPPFEFVSPVATSHGPKLVQSFFGDSTTCAATKHLQDNGVTADTLRALGPDVIVVYFTREKRRTLRRDRARSCISTTTANCFTGGMYGWYCSGWD